MARKLIAGEIVPVALFDANGVPADAIKTLSQAASLPNYSEPAANTAAVVTLAAMAGARWVIGGLYWSYNGTPTGGALDVLAGASVFPGFYITSGGPGFLPYTPPMRYPDGVALTITLAAGGAGISGMLYIHAWME